LYILEMLLHNFDISFPITDNVFNNSRVLHNIGCEFGSRYIFDNQLFDGIKEDVICICRSFTLSMFVLLYNLAKSLIWSALFSIIDKLSLLSH
jgi:hypothetical protein